MRGMSFVIAAQFVLVGCGGPEVSRSLGARCATSSECDDRCLSPSTAFPEGLCTMDCTTSLDCPEAAVCATLDGGVCLYTCTFDTDCEFLGAGWTCQDTETPEHAMKVCRGA